MTTLGVIGSGNIGSTVARLAVAGGYDVVVSNSRGPETLRDLAGQLGPRARASTAAEAAAAGDLVVVSVPLKAYSDLPVEPLAGKAVVDTANYYPERDGEIADLADGATTSVELLQRQLGRAKVVKGFNNIFFRHLAELARPAGAADRSALAIAGDDAAAKRLVTDFLGAIGYDAVDAGTLADSWRFQPGTPAYGLPYAGGNENFFEIPGVPVSAEKLRSVLAEARR